MSCGVAEVGLIVRFEAKPRIQQFAWWYTCWSESAKMMAVGISQRSVLKSNQRIVENHA